MTPDSPRHRLLRQALPWILAPLLGAATVEMVRARFANPVTPVGQDFVMNREEPLLVSEARWCELPQVFGDFDLLADVELPPDAELDVLVRRMVPRSLEGRSTIPQFHGRFTLLRLSTVAEGPPWWSRDDALLADEPLDLGGGGVRIEAGLPASIAVEGRGHELRGLVAGKRPDPVRAHDDRGFVTLVARGGTAVVHSLRIRHVPRPWDPMPRLWGALAGLVVWVLALGRGTGPWRLVLAVLVWPAVSWFVADAFAAERVPLASLPAAPMVLLALAGAPLAAAVGGRRGTGIGLGLAVVAGVVMVEAAARCERPRLRACADPRLDACLGLPADGGPRPAEALAQRVRPRYGGIETLEPADLRVMFLGGRRPFEEGRLEDALVPATVGSLLGRRAGSVQGITSAVDPGRIWQQLGMYRRFLRGFEPDVFVLGFDPHELVSEPGGNVRARLQAPPPEPPSLLLPVLLAGTTEDGPAATMADLEAAVDEVAGWAREGEAGVVLLVAPGLPEAMREVLREGAAAPRHELVVLDPTAGTEEQGRSLADGIRAVR